MREELGGNGKGGNVATDSVTRRVLVAANYADSLGLFNIESRGVMLLHAGANRG